MFNNFGQSPAVREASAFPAINIQPLMRSVYLWMTIGLAVSGVIAVTLANAFQADLNLLMGLSNLWIVMLIVQIGLAFGLGFLINRISPAVAAGLFITYAVTMGVTLSLIIFGTIASPVVDPRTGAITFTSDWSIV
ncbi:MAG: Bax inhibitor-1 family protein, partial [Aggregatilineales bacterium]